MSWFVSPKTVRIELSDGWIEVKERLTYAEQERFKTAMLQMPKWRMGDMGNADIINNSQVGMDLTRSDAIRMEMWLVDWSAEQPDPRSGAMVKVPVSREAIDQLDPAIAAEINAALVAHIEGMEARKNSPTGDKSPEAK